MQERNLPEAQRPIDKGRPFCYHGFTVSQGGNPQRRQRSFRMPFRINMEKGAGP